MLLADRGYDADWIRSFSAGEHGAWANIPPKRNRKDPICFSPYLYRARNLVERFFNRIKLNADASLPGMTNLPQTYLAFVASSQPFGFGYALMSPRPSPIDRPEIPRTWERQRTATGPQRTRRSDKKQTALNGNDAWRHPVRSRHAVLHAGQSLLYRRGQIQGRNPARGTATDHGPRIV